jgi:hypothetical protein
MSTNSFTCEPINLTNEELQKIVANAKTWVPKEDPPYKADQNFEAVMQYQKDH